jgi:integrase
VKRYLEMCDSHSLSPWPATSDNVLAFAGFMLLQKEAYSSPCVDIAAVANESFKLTGIKQTEDARLKNAKKLLAMHSAHDEEQALPISMAMLKTMYGRAVTQCDKDTVLHMLASTFTLARADSFAGLRVSDITYNDNNDTVLVNLKNLKGNNNKTLVISFETTPELGTLENSHLGTITICPVWIFREMKRRSRSTSLSCIKATAFQRCLDTLLSTSGFPNHATDRSRKCYTPHSTRVTGTCMLLRAGADPTMISTIANWTSDMVQRYGRVVFLNPEIVEPMAFYNPRAMSTRYNANMN